MFLEMSRNNTKKNHNINILMLYSQSNHRPYEQHTQFKEYTTDTQQHKQITENG